VFPHDGTTYETLLADADHRMYRDKASRRGRVAVPRTPGEIYLAPQVFEPPDELAAHADTPRSRTH
jgi:hypothetical protein